MKKLCIQVCEKAQLTIEVTEEMERDFYECWDMVKHSEEFKDCSGCSWYGMDVDGSLSLCQIVAERCSKEGRIIWDD